MKLDQKNISITVIVRWGVIIALEPEETDASNGLNL